MASAARRPTTAALPAGVTLASWSPPPLPHFALQDLLLHSSSPAAPPTDVGGTCGSPTPSASRALTHPLRLELMDVLGDGPATATRYGDHRRERGELLVPPCWPSTTASSRPNARAARSAAPHRDEPRHPSRRRRPRPRSRRRGHGGAVRRARGGGDPPLAGPLPGRADEWARRPRCPAPRREPPWRSWLGQAIQTLTDRLEGRRDDPSKRPAGATPSACSRWPTSTSTRSTERRGQAAAGSGHRVDVNEAVMRDDPAHRSATMRPPAIAAAAAPVSAPGKWAVRTRRAPARSPARPLRRSPSRPPLQPDRRRGSRMRLRRGSRVGR